MDGEKPGMFRYTGRGKPDSSAVLELYRTYNPYEEDDGRAYRVTVLGDAELNEMLGRLESWQDGWIFVPER